MPCRRYAAAGSVLLSALALAACGSSSSSTTPLSVPQATTVANQINLTSADVPGYTASPNPVTAADTQNDEQLATCSGGVPPSKDIVQLNSPTFSSGSGLTQVQVSSQVAVLPSAADVQKDLKALTSATGHACLSTQLSKVLSQTTSSAGVTIGGTTITTLPISTANTDGGFGVRITVSATAQGVHIPFFIDVDGIAKGPAEIELTALGLTKPFPADEETRLLALLISRADAHVPSS